MIEVNKIAIPFAQSGNKSVIYDTRQQGQAENEATWSTGFPPVTMIRKEDGGLPPTGLDFNGIFYDISSNIVFSCMGGQYKFDAEYAEKIGGYPKGAILLNDKENMQYISNTDNNKTNFNTADASTLTAWSIISITDIDKLLAKKIDNADFSEALNKKANTSTNVNAGNGLTGGGDLTTSRTLSLGTPSTISQNTKNSVTDSSHTHEITKATTSQQGIVQLTNTIDSSQDKAITPFAVNELQKSIEQAITEATEVPVDQVFAFDTATPPKGYIARNGQAIDQATMPKLYARYGANMPDDRDRVLRMTGTLAGTAGSTQEDAMQKIEGYFDPRPLGKDSLKSTDLIAFAGGGAFYGEYESGRTFGWNIEPTMVGTDSINSTRIFLDSSRVARTSTETRVKSRNVILCNKIQ